MGKAWPYLRRLWELLGAIIVGLAVTWLYSLVSGQPLPHQRIAAQFLQEDWPWLAGLLFVLAAVSVTAERAHRRHEARAPKPLQIARPSRLRRLLSRFKRQADAPVEVPSAQAAVSTMVGRTAELARLKEWFAQVRSGTRRVIFVAGEAGIGKTTLTRTFIDLLGNDRSLRIGRGQCVEQYGAGEPYMPILEALTRLCREPGGDKLVEILHRMAPAWLAQMPSLISAEDRARLQGLAQGTTQQRMLREMAEAIEVIAAETPLVLMLEDLHWSDPSTLDLISTVARRNEPARLMMLGTYRPVEMLAGEHPLRAVKEELELHQQCIELRLPLLSEGDVATYLAQRFSEGKKEIAPVVYARSEGNPLFMVNVVDYLIEHGSIVDPDKVEVPRTIRQMIERNMDRLSPNEQRVLEAASVAGPEFSTAAVAAALERPIAEVEACCIPLARREQFVSLAGETSWPDGTLSANVRFLHALYRDTLYERVPPVHRIEFHRRVAERAETAFGEHAREIAAALASHYVRANEHEKAIVYLTMTAEQALQRSAHADAVASASEGLKFLATLPPSEGHVAQELALQTLRGIALLATKGWAIPEVEQAFARAEELCRGLGEAPELVPVLYGIAGFCIVRGELRRTTETGLRLLEIAQKTEDSASLIVAHYLLGNTSYWSGDLLKSHQHFDELIRLYREDQHAILTTRFGMDLGLVGLAYSAGELWHRGFPDQAVNTAETAVKMARATGHTETLAWILVQESEIRVHRRETIKARMATEEIFALCEAHGLLMQSVIGKLRHGWALAVEGNYETGCAEIREGFRASAAPGLVLGESEHHMMLAQALLLAGRAEEGLASLDEPLSAKSEERIVAGELCRIRGELLLRRDGIVRSEISGGPEDAFREAIRIAQSQSAKSFELRATTSVARLLRDTGRRDEARTMLAEIYSWFTEGFDTKDLKEAKVLLNELS
jgi:hypothetical protein